jgi:hypothetical protein
MAWKDKTIIYIFLAVIILGLTWLLAKTSRPADNWVCVKGEWTRHGNPASPKPDKGCGSEENNDPKKIKAFFSNTALDPGMIDCSKVYPLEREIGPDDKYRAAVNALLGGINENEKASGYLTNINSGVEIQSLEITNGVAKVDMSKKLDEGVAGSCRVTAIRSQITETLKQFSEVKEVIISINGRSEDVLQP